MKLDALSDSELVAKVDRMVEKERASNVELLFHLLEIERRKIHLELGYSSLFDYCTKKLLYSESGAGRRIAAARALGDHPELSELLLAGEVNLCTVSAAAQALRTQPSAEILGEIKGKSKREVEVILAKRTPVTSKRERIKPIAVKPPPPLTLFSTPTGGSSPEPEVRHEFTFSGDEEFLKLVEEGKSRLSSKYPNGVSLEKLFYEALLALREKRCPKIREERRIKRAKRAVPDKSIKSKPNSRHIPARIKDQVYLRDGGRCTYVANGTRCRCTHDLEIDHLKPFGKGGDHSIDNLRLLCQPHNLLMAEKEYGKEVIAKFLKGP